MKSKLSISAAAKHSGYTWERVKYWLDEGMLAFEEVPGPGPNRIRRIRRADLDNFLERYYGLAKSKERKPLILEKRPA